MRLPSRTSEQVDRLLMYCKINIHKKCLIMSPSDITMNRLKEMIKRRSGDYDLKVKDLNDREFLVNSNIVSFLSGDDPKQEERKPECIIIDDPLLDNEGEE